MADSTKNDAAAGGLTTPALIVAALAVLVCACAALLLGTAGGTVEPATQSTQSDTTTGAPTGTATPTSTQTPTPTPTPTPAPPVGRLDEGQEWALIVLMWLLPLGALALLWRLAARPRTAGEASARGARDWPKFKPLSPKGCRAKLTEELERVGRGFQSRPPESLERDTLDAKSLALLQLFQDMGDWLLGPFSLDREDPDTAFDALMQRGEKVAFVDVLYLPESAAREAAADANDALMREWQQPPQDRVNAAAARVNDAAPWLKVSAYLVAVTSGLSGKEKDKKDARDKFRASLNGKLKASKTEIKAIYYDLGELRQAFVPSENEEAGRPPPPDDTRGVPPGGGGGGGSVDTSAEATLAEGEKPKDPRIQEGQ